MATPTKPGEKVILTESYADVKHGQFGRVARRKTSLTKEPTWDVMLDSGKLLEVEEQHLSCVSD